MRYFFIDTENVQQYDFIDEIELNADDKIIMFISERSKKIRIEDLMRFTNCNADIAYENVYTGASNALDFQLIAKLSLTIGLNQNKDAEYFVVSNDNDFILPTKYLINNTSVSIQLLKTQTNQIEINLEEVALDIENEYDFDKKTTEVINNSETLSELHNNLRALHGNEKGRKLYLEIKKIFNKYKDNLKNSEI